MVTRPRVPVSVKIVFATIFSASQFGGTCSCAQAPVSISVVQTPDRESLTKRVQVNVRRLQQAQAVDSQIRQMLSSVAQPSREAIESAKQRNRQLALSIAAMETAFNDFKATNAAGTASIADLEHQLTDAEGERDQLVKRQTVVSDTLAVTTSTKGLRQESIIQDLQPIPIMLVKNRVVPLMPPFYSVRAARLTVALTGEQVDGIVASRVHDGESVANAVRPGGLLDTFMNKAEAKSKYFRFTVCSDSVLGFYTASEAVAKRGFAYSWDTGKDEDIVRSVDQLRRQQGASTSDRGYWPTNTAK